MRVVQPGHSVCRIQRHVPELGDLGSRRLDLAQFVGAARQQLGLGSVPVPLIAEPGMRHAMGRSLDLGVVPAPAAVGGHLHSANGSPTGPGQAADLVEAAAGQLLTAGRKGDDRFRSDLVVQRRDFRVLIEMPVVVVVQVVPVHQLDSPQILGVKDSFEAGNHQPQRKPVLGPHRLAVHAVGHQTVVHALGQRHARRSLHFFHPFCNEPGGPGFHAGLLEQHREGYSGPFGATGHPVRFLNGLRPRRRPVPRALDEMQAGDGREALQVLHGENQRTVHHAVDHEPMLAGIDVRDVGATGRPHEVERGWRDHPHRILKRARHMKHEPEGIGRRPAADGMGYADRGHETGAIAVGDQLLAALDERGLVCGCLAARGRDGSHGQTTGQRGAALQESPSIRSFRTHRSLLRR